MEYDLLLKKITNVLSRVKQVVLATASKKGIVTASKMCVVSDGIKLYFQTHPTFEKVRNIMENPNVAITIGNMYFKGQASIIGHPSQNAFFVNKMKEKHFKTYESYTNLPNQILIKVELTECRLWGIHNNIETIKVMDLKKNELTEIKCENLKSEY